MLVGYARVSTYDQDLSLQLDALKAAGCETLYRDTASGARGERPGLTGTLEHLRSGDILIVWRLDRLGRSLSQLIALMTQLEGRGVGFRSLTEQIDTTTPGGRLIFHIFGALAEFERTLIRERTMAGLAAARARGRHGGRPRRLDTDRKVRLARQLHEDRNNSIADVCLALGISRATLYRYLAMDDTPAPGEVTA
jgi:DNA invertase Pin-like site-specific DNA recombinase